MAQLILLRHLQSQWNLENRFAGWVDIPLSKEGVYMAREVAQKLAEIKIDVVYTSNLIRNQDTVLRIWEYLNKKYPIFLYLEGKMKKRGNFTDLNKNYLPVFVSENLNERYYGKLQGLNREETIKKYGAQQVLTWRRSFETRPPAGESLKDTFNRAVPFYRKYVVKDLREGRNVLVVASHNSLRALVKYIEKISDKDIINFEIEIGAIIEYEFDKDLAIKNKTTL